MISSGIAIFSDVSKRCNILLSQYIAIKTLIPGGYTPKFRELSEKELILNTFYVIGKYKSN